MKKTVTKSYSLPPAIVQMIDETAAEMHISASALLTVLLTLTMKNGTKEALNSIYGRDTDGTNGR